MDILEKGKKIAELGLAVTKNSQNVIAGLSKGLTKDEATVTNFYFEECPEEDGPKDGVYIKLDTEATWPAAERHKPKIVKYDDWLDITVEADFVYETMLTWPEMILTWEGQDIFGDWPMIYFTKYSAGHRWKHTHKYKIPFYGPTGKFQIRYRIFGIVNESGNEVMDWGEPPSVEEEYEPHIPYQQRYNEDVRNNINAWRDKVWKEDSRHKVLLCQKMYFDLEK